MEDAGYTPFIEGRRRKSSKKRLLITATIIFVVVLLGIFGMQLLSPTASPQVVPTPTPTSFQFPTDTPTPTATAEAVLSPTTVPTPGKKSSLDSKTKLDRKNLTVIIENGSGVVGAANSAATLLKDAGYVVSGTRNATEFTYEDVTISVKAEKAAYIQLLRQDLASMYTIGTTNTTLASGSADAVVIIGK